jgi:hypothetical protein
MERQEVTVQLGLTKSDWRAGLWDMPEMRRAVIGLAVAWVFSGVALGAALAYAPVSESDTSVLLVLCVLGFPLFAWAFYRSRMRQFDSLLALRKDMAVTFSASEVSFSTSVGSSKHLYQGLYTWCEGTKTLLVYMQKGMAQFIPKRSFQPDELVAVRNWLSSGVKQPPRERYWLKLLVVWLVLVAGFLFAFNLLTAR